MAADNRIIPFETFANFQRVPDASPLLYYRPPDWGAAAHAIVVGDTIHYLWARRLTNVRRWVILHSEAPIHDPAVVRHDPANPILEPSADGFDSTSTEYPFPFWNPLTQRYNAYYLGRNAAWVKQTGLLARGKTFSEWKRVLPTPVIAAEADCERKGSSHPSVAIDGDTIHILYTGESDKPPVICHATAPLQNPAAVTKDPANPVFTGSGADWDCRGVREAEIFRGPSCYHIFYGGYDGKTWRIGHVRTCDFRTFEPSPYNPIFTPSSAPDAWDCDGLLTPQVFEVNGVYYMLYAGLKGKEWQSGLAVAR